MKRNILLLFSTFLFSSCLTFDSETRSSNQKCEEPCVRPNCAIHFPISHYDLKQELEEIQKTIETLTSIQNFILENQKLAQKNSEIRQKEEKDKKRKEENKTLDSQNKILIGQEEWIFLNIVNQSYLSRIDTGASLSSINATDIVEFERDGKKWVQFNVAHGSKDENIIVECPIERYTLIKQSLSEERDRRPVVKLYATLGNQKVLTEFTLADRQHMEFPILIGRNFIMDLAIVDVSLKYTQEKATD